MDEILKELGFTDGFLLPVANSENKELELEIQKYHKERENLVSTLDDETVRLKSLKKYLENVLHEQLENQKLLYVYDSQTRAEENSVKLIQGQLKSLNAEEKELVKAVEEVKIAQDHCQDETSRMVGRLDTLRAQVQWDQAALQAWSTAAFQIGEDFAVLEQFSQQDQQRFKLLELTRMKLRQEVLVKRQRLDNLTGDVLSREQALEKTGSLFHNQHKDRQALVDQWFSASRVLQQRDEDIHRAMAEIGRLRTQAKLRMQELDEQKTFYANELRNNKEAERETSSQGREAREAAAAVQELESTISDLSGQFLVARGSLTSMARLVQNHRSYCRRVATQIVKKRDQCLKLEHRMEELHLQMQESYGKKLSAEDRVSYLLEIQDQERQTEEKLRTENVKLQEKVRLVSEELNRLRTVEKDQRRAMAGLEATAQSLRQRTTSAVAEQRRQQEILYKAEINYLEKDIQYRRMLGRTDPEDVERCQQNLQRLQTAMEDGQSSHQLLEREVYRLDQEYRRLVVAKEADERELRNLRSKKQELMLIAETGEKRLAALRSANQDKQVDESVVRLRVSHLEKAVRRVGNQLYTLERQRLELEEAVKERSMEVGAHLDVLNVRKRALAEQLSTLNTNINIAKLKVDHLQTKHKLHMQSMSLGDGEVLSVTQLKIKAAQERYELQQMGDKLDAKIRTTEWEITAMENTLQTVLVANSLYKGSLSRLPADGPELQEKEALEVAYVALLEQVRVKRSVLQNLQEATVQIQEDLQSQLELESNLLKYAAAKTSDLADMSRRLDAQADKMSRAARDLRLMHKQIYGLHKQPLKTLEEKDMFLRELREQNQTALQLLGEVAVRIIETGPVIARYLRDKGLSLPVPSARLSTSSRATSIVASSRYTIDSVILGDKKPQKNVQRRPSILKSEKEADKLKRLPQESTISESIDIINLVPKSK